jgi:CO/xanthine dehydrogenase Mo-binding subunit
MRVEGMIYASTIRSPVAKASAIRVVPGRLPPAYRCILPSDLASEGISMDFAPGIPLFGGPASIYRGEALGLVAGPDPAICDELAAEMTIEYEEEEPELEWESFSSSQIVEKYAATVGGPDLEPAPGRIIERSVYRNGIFDHRYSEPMGALASWEYDKLAVHCATQWPAHVRKSVAGVLGVPDQVILVRPTDLGVSLDGRLWFPSLVACHAAAAAKILSKPVRILYTRQEDYLFTPKQARSAVTLTSAMNQQGKLSALDVKIVINIGAYNPLARELLLQASAAMTGVYYCPALHIEAYAVRSNIVPLGALGGMGATHASFPIESHLNHAAKALQKTPKEIKTVNILRRGMEISNPLSPTFDIPFEKIHKTLEAMSDYRRKYASYELVKKRDPGCRDGIVRGIALTVGYQTSRSFSKDPLMNSYSVEIRLDRDLKVAISTQTAVGSNRLLSLWKTTASGILSIPEESISILAPDTDTAAGSGPLTLSRGTMVINRLIERSCKAIQKKRFRESLPLVAKAQTKLGYREGGAPASQTGRDFETPSLCGTALEVEIDTLTGEPRAIAIWMAIDAGRIVNRESARSAIRNSALNALNLCVGKEFNPDRVNRNQFLEMRLLPMSESPQLYIEFIEPDRNVSPRGLGELPFQTIPAAFHSALTQALGVEPGQLPIQGGEILRLLEAT